MKNQRIKKALAAFLALVTCFTVLCVPASAAAKKPATPKISSVKATSGNSFKISWKKVSGASGYVLYAKYSGGSYKAVKTASKNTTSYTHKNLKFGKTYYYKLRAYKTSRGKRTYSSYSKVVSNKTVTLTLSAPKISSLNLVDCNTLKLSWKKVSGASAYLVYEKEYGAGGYKMVKKVSGTTYSLTRTGLKVGKKYFYRVCAVKSYGGKQYNGKQSSEIGKKTTNDLLTLAMPYAKSSAWIYNNDGGSFTMAGDKYTSGIELDSSMGAYAIFNLKNKYKKISFTLCDCRDYDADAGSLQVFADDECVKTIYTKPKGLPQDYVVDIENAGKLEFRSKTFDMRIANIKVYK